MNWNKKVLIESICFALLLCQYIVFQVFCCPKYLWFLAKTEVVFSAFGSCLDICADISNMKKQKNSLQARQFFVGFCVCFFCLSSSAVQPNCLQAAAFLFSRRLFFFFLFAIDSQCVSEYPTELHEVSFYIAQSHQMAQVPSLLCQQWQGFS